MSRPKVVEIYDKGMKIGEITTDKKKLVGRGNILMLQNILINLKSGNITNNEFLINLPNMLNDRNGLKAIIKGEKTQKRNNPNITTKNNLKPYDNWIIPNAKIEEGEIERTAKELNLNFNTLYDKIKQGRMINLNDEMIKYLRNTDYPNIKNLKQAIQKAKKYGKDYKKVGSLLKYGKKIYAPIFINYNGKLYCVSGNTRLMIAKGLGIRPKIWLVTIDKRDNNYDMQHSTINDPDEFIKNIKLPVRRPFMGE